MTAEQGGGKKYSVPISVEEVAEMAKLAREAGEKHREEVRQRPRHPSNVGNHPVMHDKENTEGVLYALLQVLPVEIDVLAAMREETGDKGYVTLSMVFAALLNALPDDQHREWNSRWILAESVEMRRRDYNRDYDRSLASISWGGQGGG